MSDELTPREVAASLGITVRTVQRWIADGRLPSVRVGARTRVPRSALSAVTDAPAATAWAAIRTLLVANRGEIASRIARSARAMGIRVIGVVGPADHVPQGVDGVHTIGSYLDGDELIGVARAAGADAVHPGYGFLAENPEFAAAVEQAGLRWVGPPASAIAAMGDKAAARRRAAELGVPTIPGYDGDDQDDATLAAEAERIGFPLLIKPSAGGGGKGMRVVRAPEALVDGLEGARREAQRAFDDDRLVLERLVEHARHVEVQVLFDRHGNGVHLGERDCSAQRRSQKITEEAPAPSVTPQLRERVGAAALALAGGIGYVSAGTVEMLLTDAGEFFFLEMNTRLQVEHPVTEAITGRDLVADQLRIAGGATLRDLGLTGPPSLRGHAIEARLYAEDPGSGFLPATGRLALVHWPDGVRVDAGACEGDEVTDRYDPMLAKLIAHGATRSEALGRLRAALDTTTVLGVRTNLRFLRWLLDQPPMRDGEMRTDTVAGLDLPTAAAAEDRHWQAAALALATATAPEHDPWAGGWRLNAPPVRRVRHEGEDRTVALPTTSSAAGWTWQGPTAVLDGEVAHVDVDGQSLEFRLAPPPSVEEAVRHAIAAAGEGASVLVAPMPGRVIAVRVREGAAVRALEAVVIIEAMKMEHAVVAPGEGVVSRLRVTEGQQVQRGEIIAEVVPYDDGDG